MNTGNLSKIIKMLMLLSLFLFIQNCSSKSKLSAIDTYLFEIFFGSTGGFSNINPVFMVKSNGEVQKKDNAFSEPFLLKKITKPTLDSLYVLIRESNFATLKINRISNITKYIEIKSEKFTNKVSWFDDSQIPVELLKLNKALINTIKN